jgi:hypothetical protein
MWAMITHDATRKHLFQAPEIVRDLVHTYVPHPWLCGLDFSTLEPIPASFVHDEMRQFHSDAIWRLKADGQWVYVYLLIEFQSGNDPHMALRIMTYLALLYQALVRQKQTLAQHRLPPVLPIVLYSGEAPWNSATDIAELIVPLPIELQPYTPSLRYILVDEERHMPPEGLNNLLAHLMRFAHAQDPARRLYHLEEAGKLVQNNLNLSGHIHAWLQALWVQKGLNAADLPTEAPPGDFIMAFKFGFEKWAEGMQSTWLRQGIEQGIEQGSAKVLQTLLTQRFGPLPVDLQAKLQQATSDQLDLWVARVLAAPTLIDVFEGEA